MPARPPRLPAIQTKNTRMDKWARGWLLGKSGLSGAATDLVHSVDPRSPQGLIGALSMMVPGKGSAENAMAAHLGHSEFRPYNTTNRSDLGFSTSPDHELYGGMHSDSGYGNPSRFVQKDVNHAINQILMKKHPQNLLEKLLGPPYRSWRNAGN